LHISAERIAAYSSCGRPSRPLGNSSVTTSAQITFGSPPNACCSNSRMLGVLILDLGAAGLDHRGRSFVFELSEGKADLGCVK
jgi:hypothetical protein